MQPSKHVAKRIVRSDRARRQTERFLHGLQNWIEERGQSLPPSLRHRLNIRGSLLGSSLTDHRRLVSRQYTSTAGDHPAPSIDLDTVSETKNLPLLPEPLSHLHGYSVHLESANPSDKSVELAVNKGRR
jgi:hypothetical protein